MAEYRAYLLKSDGHILRRFDFVCDDDDDAKVRAKQLVDGMCALLTTFQEPIALGPLA